MIKSLESLLERLVLLTSCAGEPGCLVTDLLASILVLVSVSEFEPSRDEVFRILENPTSTAYRTTAVIWKWVAERKDVSIGEKKRYNDLALNEILALAGKSVMVPPATNQPASQTNAETQHSLKLYVSEETMWESLTGHGVDYKRIPRSEWILLQGIASTTLNGILQGDLGRLVGQDKRSVPKRTSCLVEKGYITKRTTLVRGTKTSKLWLKFLAPSTPKESSDRGDAETDITLSRQCLVDSLEPVPWHTRWTGDSIDYRVLATTIMATCKEWKVMRLQDLKSKLGVLGMTWQMKVISKICRFLNARGMIQYVAAKLKHRIFKDCIRFTRDMNARDWSIFLATGKRTTKSSKVLVQENAEDESNTIRIARSEQRAGLPRCPSWTIYTPMTSLVAICIQESGDDGLTNPQLSAMTLGPSFTRYLAGLTASISSESIQPENAKHLAIKSERGRPGKSSSLYWYFMASSITDHCNLASKPIDNKPKSKAKTKKEEHYQFASLMQLNNDTFQVMTLSELCCRGLSRQKKKGRPKKIKLEDQSILTNPSSQEPMMMTDLTPKTDHLDVENSLVIETEEEPTSNNGIATWEESSEPMENGEFHKGAAPEPRTEPGTSHRGRPRGRGSARVGRVSLSSKENTSDSRHFKCARCSGTWKNDLGLKYHLEKSQTPCNPSFKPHLMTPTKKQLKFAGRGGQIKKMTKSAKEANNNPEDSFADTKASRALSVMDESRRPASQPAPMRTTSARRKRSRVFDSPSPTEDITDLSGQAELLSTAILLPPRQVDPFTKHARQPTVHDRTFEVFDNFDMSNSLKGLQTVTSHASEASSAVLVLPSSASVTPKIKDASEKRNIKNPARRNAMDIITTLLHKYGGALPAGPALEMLVGTTWVAQLPNEDVPSGTMIKSAMQQMIRDKTIVDQWHAFRAQDGKIGKCQIITIPSVPAFAPEARALVERIRQLYPATILSEQFPGIPPPLNQHESNLKKEQEPDLEMTNRSDNKVGGRGRRSLAAGVAILTAPVYAAQLATKRPADDVEATNLTGKRRRRAEGMTDALDESLSHPFWPIMDQLPPLDNIEQPPLFSCAAFTLDILFQNLYRDSNGVCEGQMPLWPHAGGSSSFERLASTMHQQGWLPCSNWFSWASTCHYPIEAHTLASAENSEFDFFLEKLGLCLAIELDTVGGIQLPTEAHSTFVNFIGGDAGRHLSTPDVQWSKSDRHQSINSNASIRADDDESGLSSASGDEHMEPNIATVQRAVVLGSATLHHTLPMPTRPVILASRNLTSLSPDEDGSILTTPNLEFDNNELVAAFVVIRSLLGGVDKAIDWGLMIHLFPNIGLESLRRFWARIRKEKASFLSKATQDFQDSIIVAIQKDDISIPDYDEPQEYDWKALIQWAMRHPNQEQLQLPTKRDRFHHEFELEDGNKSVEDWKEKFFHPQSSVYSRFEAATLQPGSLTATEVKQASYLQPGLSTVDIARSWIRSLCCTSETEYTPQDVKERFSSLSQDALQQSTVVLKAAIDQLTQERVICKSKRTPLGGRPYRLNEGYTSTLAKLAHRQKYIDAFSFKEELDTAVRHSNGMRVPYTLSDGAVMALTNLIANDRIRVAATKVPNIPFGFEPGNYESRKYPKSYYHLDLEVKPTRSYLLNDDVEVLQIVRRVGPPREGRGREIPQWIDFFGKLDEQRWADILSAVCFALSTRGIMSVMGVCDALAPILEVFEARLIIAWGIETGVFASEARSTDIRLGEWWWLVPQQP